MKAGKQIITKIIKNIKTHRANSVNKAILRAVMKRNLIEHDQSGLMPEILKLKNKQVSQNAHAILALGNIGNSKAVNILVNKLNDHHPVIRASAVWALTNIGDPMAGLPVSKLVKDKSPLVRKYVAWALGKLATR